MNKAKPSVAFLFEKQNIPFKLCVVDLEAQLSELKLPIANHGRIDWPLIDKFERIDFLDDASAARELSKILTKKKLDEILTVTWSNDLTYSLLIDVKILIEFLESIVSEDWDFWIVPASGKWIIEKYHEGEICYFEIE